MNSITKDHNKEEAIAKKLFGPAYRTRGFSLVELMITIAILGIALLAYIQSNLAINQSAELAYEQSVAFYDSQKVLEDIRNIAQTGTFPTNVLQAFPDSGYISGYNHLPNETVSVSYGVGASDPLDVTVTVNWLGDNRRTISKSIRSLITKRIIV